MSKRVDLRKAYKLGGYSGEYSWFVREKVLPIIGRAALHAKACKRGSRVKEYTVTRRNLDRVTKSLGLERVKAVSKVIAKAGPDATAKMMLTLMETTKEPGYPIGFKIPLHPISHNMLYKAAGNRMVRTPRYNSWREEFFNMMSATITKDTKGVDFTRPLDVKYTFGHREASDRGGVFDRTNMQKAAQDCAFEYFGFDDSKVLDSSISGEFVDSYAEGFMELHIRNTGE